RNLPLIYVDGKGSIKLAQRIQQLCIKYQRTLKVFTVDPHDEVPELATYNPLAFGNFTEWKNKIVTLTGEAETKGQEHYLIQEQSYINLVCEILNKSKRYMDFEGLLGYIKHPEELQKLANQIDPELALRLVKTGSNDKETADIVKILEVFYYSHYGHLFSTSKQPSKQIINLQQSLKQGEIVLFLLDGASLKRDTSLLGRLIINDINSAWAGFGRCGETIKGYCIFDEFAAYAAPNLANILAMQRDNGLHAIVGTQSLNAISMENSLVKRIAVELIANCNTYIIHKLNDPKDIELLIKTTGTHKGYEVTSGYAATNNHQWISTKVVDQSLIEPQAIRELSSGYGYVCRTVLKMQPQKVKFNFIG
ncbi:MAG: TraM recognition domain-containing protein, partial [Burkholderiales bacterium]